MENKVTHEKEGNENPPEKPGMANYLCRFFSYPVIKARESVAGQWSKKQKDAFK